MTDKEETKGVLSSEESETARAIRKCREIVEKKSKENGRKLTYHSVTFGCQMNAEPEI